MNVRIPVQIIADSAAPSVRRRYASGTTGRLLPLDAPRCESCAAPMTGQDVSWAGGNAGYVGWRYCVPCRLGEQNWDGAA